MARQLLEDEIFHLSSPSDDDGKQRKTEKPHLHRLQVNKKNSQSLEGAKAGLKLGLKKSPSQPTHLPKKKADNKKNTDDDIWICGYTQEKQEYMLDDD